MSEIKDEAPAFPAAGMTGRGMSLRQYLAAHAPITLAEAGEKYAQNYGHGSFGDVLDYLADLRWAYADAMISRQVKK